MKKFLIPLLAALALPTAVNTSEISEPVSNTVVSDKQNNLLFEIQALPEKIENTSLKKDLITKTSSFLNTLAESTPEEVGENLYLNAKKLSSALDILYETWSRRNVLVGGYGWNIEKNFATKNSLDLIFGGNTIEIKCTKRFVGLLAGGVKIRGQDISKPVAKVIAHAAQQIDSPESIFVFPSNQEPAFVRSTAANFCPGDPNAPVEEEKPKEKDKPRQPVKVNCDSPIWKNKPRCN